MTRTTGLLFALSLATCISGCSCQGPAANDAGQGADAGDAAPPPDGSSPADATGPSDSAPVADAALAADAAAAVDSAQPTDAAPTADSAQSIDAAPAADSAQATDAVPAADSAQASDAAPAVDTGLPLDAALPVDGASAGDASQGVDAGSADAAPGACVPVRLTYYSGGENGGACGPLGQPAYATQLVRDGYFAAMAEPWYGGALGGNPAEACGECWELSTAAQSHVVMITDLCPIQGNPVCAGGFFHFDVNQGIADELGYLAAGIVEARVRRVPCPVEGNIRVVVDASSSQWWMGLYLVDARVAIRTLEYRGAGPGVSADNPWTAIARSAYNSWEISASDSVARGGTGIRLRLTTAQGQSVESTVLVPMVGGETDLGVQVDELAPPSGPACSWRAPDPYVDAVGGIPEVRWLVTGWGQSDLVTDRQSGCRAGACLGVALEGWGGIQFIYNQPFDVGIARVALQASTPTSAPLQLVLSNGSAECTPVAVAAGPSFVRAEVELASACAGVSGLTTIQLQNMQSGPIDLVLDDVVLE